MITLIPATLSLILARLSRSPAAWIGLLASCLLGPTLDVFAETAPVWEPEGGSQAPWLFLLALLGATLGMGMAHDTVTLRREQSPRIGGDLLLVATPALLFTGAGLASLLACSASAPAGTSILSTLHLASLAVLLLPLGPLALVAATWVLPALLPPNLAGLMDPTAHEAAPWAQVCLLGAILILSALRPHALRHTR